MALYTHESMAGDSRTAAIPMSRRLERSIWLEPGNPGAMDGPPGFKLNGFARRRMRVDEREFCVAHHAKMSVLPGTACEYPPAHPVAPG